jgi:orotidine-5'-phosphate decarboxylase
MQPTDPATVEAVEGFLFEVVDRLEKRVAIVKPQIALFEQLGWRGIRLLESVVIRCHTRGLLVLLDAKRGDIGSTAEGYARAYLEPGSPLPADAMTLNGYLGRDSLEPFLTRCSEHGRGVFVLTKTSNPGSGDLQDRLLGEQAVFEAMAAMLCESSEALRGPVTGWSSLGVVVGATYPEPAERVRAVLPHSLFLVPGFGAQGASVSDAVTAFVDGPNGREGGVVSSSRAILYPGTDSVWEVGFEAGLDESIHRLGDAIR